MAKGNSSFRCSSRICPLVILNKDFETGRHNGKISGSVIHRAFVFRILLHPQDHDSARIQFSGRIRHYIHALLITKYYRFDSDTRSHLFQTAEEYCPCFFNMGHIRCIGFHLRRIKFKRFPADVECCYDSYRVFCLQLV